MELLFQGLICIVQLGGAFFWFTGLLAIYRRDVKNHQFRMLAGLGLLFIGFILLTSLRFKYTPLYEGVFVGAFDLVWWLNRGLSISSMLLASLAIWAMLENVWDLHKRAGMFAFVSGMVAQGMGLSMILMIWFL